MAAQAAVLHVCVVPVLMLALRFRLRSPYAYASAAALSSYYESRPFAQASAPRTAQTPRGIRGQRVSAWFACEQALIDYQPMAKNPRSIDGIILTKFDTVDDKVRSFRGGQAVEY